MKGITSKMICLVVFTLIQFTLIGCSTPQSARPTTATQNDEVTQEADMFTLTSSAFVNSGYLSDRYTYKSGTQCNGENYSPPLNWAGAPVETKSFLLTVIDPDGGNWVHWLLVNIPADLVSLEEAPAGPAVGIAGRNSFGKNGYGGPCPPSGTHHYIFTLYALDTLLDIKPGITLQQVSPLFKEHVLAQCQLVGLRAAK